MFKYWKIRLVCVLFELIKKVMRIGDARNHSESIMIHSVKKKYLDPKVWICSRKDLKNYHRNGNSFDITLFVEEEK